MLGLSGGVGGRPSPAMLCHSPITYTAVCALVTEPSPPASASEGITLMLSKHAKARPNSSSDAASQLSSELSCVRCNTRDSSEAETSPPDS